MTPGEFEAKYGVNQKVLRAYLRSRWRIHVRHSMWHLTDEMVVDACEHFSVGQRTGRGSAPLDQRCLAGPKPSSVRSPGSSSGLHHQVLSLALRAGIPLALGQSVPWLSNRGHLDEFVRRRAPDDVIASLSDIHRVLGGNSTVLVSKRSGNPPTPDLIHLDLGCIIEIDEIQHFTSARLQSFDFYSSDIRLGFDKLKYVQLVEMWRAKGDRAFAHKVAADFPQRGGRQAQRAYNDVLRDLLAPTFTNHPVIRIALPDRVLEDVVERLQAALARLTASE